MAYISLTHKPFITDRYGHPEEVFGAAIRTIGDAFSVLRSHIENQVFFSLKEQDPTIPIHKNEEAKRIIRDIIKLVDKETTEKYYIQEADYADKRPARREAVSHITDSLIFNSIMEWRIGSNAVIHKWSNYMYTDYVHRTLQKYDNHIIVFIKGSDLKLYWKVLEDCGYNLKIDLDFSNPLMIGHEIIGVHIPEENINFLRLCMGNTVLDTKLADEIKFVGTAIFYELPMDRNDLPKQYDRWDYEGLDGY